MDQHELIQKYLEERISAEEMESLVAWLREEPARLDQLVQAGTLELELYEIMRREVFCRELDQHLKPIPEPSGTDSFLWSLRSKNVSVPLPRRLWDRFLAF